MKQAIEILGDAGGRILMTVDGYENPRATDADDANWLRASVEVSCHGFSGSQSCSLMTHDFLNFLEALKAMVFGEASASAFATDEDWLRLDLSKSATGSVTVSGKLRGGVEMGTALRFAFTSALGNLESSLAELEVLVEAFPVKS